MHIKQVLAACTRRTKKNEWLNQQDKGSLFTPTSSAKLSRHSGLVVKHITLSLLIGRLVVWAWSLLWLHCAEWLRCLFVTAPVRIKWSSKESAAYRYLFFMTGQDAIRMPNNWETSQLTAMGSFWAISISSEYRIHSTSFLITPVNI